jgi:steroid 5-alpha reductase family enzyme
MVWAWTVSLSVIFVMASKVDVKIGALDGIGWAFWAIGFIFEVLADQTKHMHYANEKSEENADTSAVSSKSPC